MKKVFALGVASLLMMGTASQAMADAYDRSNLYLTVYNKASNQEKLWDLGLLSDMTVSTTVAVATGIDVDSWNAAALTPWGASTSGIGLFAVDYTNPNGLVSGYVGNKDADGTAALTKNYTKATGYYDFATSVSSAYKSVSGGVSPWEAQTTWASSYATKLFNTYGGMITNTSSEAEYKTLSDVNLYLYHFDTKMVEGVETLYQKGDSYAASFVLKANGELFLTANNETPAVPVPGTALLLGSALLGLTGLRRRNNA